MKSSESRPSCLADFRDRHRGESVLVCGCGRSLNLLPGVPRLISVAVNDVGRLFDPTYLVVLNPPEQFKADRFQHVAASRARAVFSHLPLELDRAPLIRFRLGERGGTIFDDGETLPCTLTSTYVALCLAAFMGARSIGLLGVDFTSHHFFASTGEHWLNLNIRRMDEEFRRLGQALSARKVEVVNLSPESRLSAFPKAELDAFLGSPRPFACATVRDHG